ncbi:hypothetical protein IG631_09341 [Alternaria alternata]|nr:hypothetical protein IG631_09341 [Alternaria alternata]
MANMLREGFTFFDKRLTRSQLQPPGKVSGKCRGAPFARLAGHATRRSNKELPSPTEIQTAAFFLAWTAVRSCQERTEKAITTSSAGKVVPGCLLEMILNRDRSTVSRADQHKVQGLTRPGVKDTIDREALPCTGNAARDEDRIRTWLSRFATLTFRARSGHLSTCCACSTLFHAHRYGALKALLMRTV